MDPLAALIPRPKRAVPRHGVVSGTPRARPGAGCQLAAEVLGECVEDLFGAHAKGAAPFDVRLELTGLVSSDPIGDEGYALTVADGGALVQARSHRGLLYGIHTLLYLARVEPTAGIRVPTCEVEDWPDYRMRGLQDDPARGQVSTTASYERLIRELSRLKYNVLTFHTEDMFAFEKHRQSGASMAR